MAREAAVKRLYRRASLHARENYHLSSSSFACSTPFPEDLLFEVALSNMAAAITLRKGRGEKIASASVAPFGPLVGYTVNRSDANSAAIAIFQKVPRPSKHGEGCG
ncbi:hypothetical protein MHYP_G00204320 [Metynnis hypsauchen]